MDILNIFDLVVVIIMTLIIIRSWIKGFSGILLSSASFVLSAILAWILHPQLATVLDNGEIPYTVWRGIAIVIIYIVSFIVCTVASYIINMFFKLPVLKSANKILGLLLGIISALLLAKIAAISIAFIFDSLRIGDISRSLIVKIFNS